MFHNADEKSDAFHEIKPHEIALRSKLVEEILELSPHASPAFLSRFTSDQLRAYYDHLQLTQEPRGTLWKRRSNSPAVVKYRPSA